MTHDLRRAGAPLLLTAVVAISGCAGGAGGDDGEPALGNVARSPDAKTLSLPLDAYLGTPATTRAVNQARIAVFTACMRRFGFEPQPPPLPPLPASFNEARYGLAALDQAQRYGYHPTPQARQERGATEPPASAAAQAVAQGTGERVAGLPEGGCLGEARRRMADGAPPQPDAQVAERLDADSSARAGQDSRVRSAIARWSECMRGAGHDYDHPLKANDDPRFRTPRPTPLEITVATADVRCKEQVNLVGTWLAVETAYQRRAIERNAEALRDVKALLDVQVRNAAQILDGA
jgi:hypothetical protein